MFLLEINSIDQIKKYANKVDGFILGYEKFTSFGSKCFSYEEISEITHSIDKLIYINLNAMMHNSDSNEFRSVLLKLKELPVHFIIQDLGASMLAKEIGIINRSIFNPYTYITNSNDALCYYELGFEGVIISSEITLKDLLIINDKVGNCGSIVFGYHPMYQSYRHIVDLYKETNNLNFENNDLSIREFTRDFKSYVIDNEYGSVVFRPYVISLLNEFDAINNLKYCIINTIFLNDEKIDLIVDTIYKLNNKELYSDEVSLLLKDHFNIESGFTYNDSVYNPKEF